MYTDWLMYWLSKHTVFRKYYVVSRELSCRLTAPGSGTARTLDVSTRTFGLDTAVMSEMATSDDISKGRRISFLPSLDTKYTLWYKFRYVSVTRHQVNDSPWHTRSNLHIQ